VNNYKLIYTKQAKKDAEKVTSSGLKSKVEELLDNLRKDPLQDYPPYEKLVGDLAGAYSRRINIQRRLVCQVYKKEKIVKVIRMWSHYEGALQNHDFVFDFIRRGSSLHRRYAFCHRHPFGRNGRQ
jgi:Txe/YoeB family toxin of toxin-antitoxin system